jgi:hypothetical protein
MFNIVVQDLTSDYLVLNTGILNWFWATFFGQNQPFFFLVNGIKKIPTVCLKFSGLNRFTLVTLDPHLQVFIRHSSYSRIRIRIQ